MAPDPGATRDAALATLAHHFQAMPPVAALRIRVDSFDGDCLRLSAPLAVHVNDKGCAFGGSLGSLMTLAAWGVVTLKLQAAGLAADVFVADSDVRFLAPLFADLHAEARLADPGDWDDFIARLRERGRAGLRLAACVRLPDGAVAASSRSRYVAVARG
jgi:thioesterase domain-containing protein